MDNNSDTFISNHSVGLDLILTLITVGLWNVWIQIRQIVDLNFLLREERYSLLKVAILSLITFGLYFVYHEYRMTKDLHILIYGQSKSSVSFFTIVLSFLGFWFIVDAHQQHLLNVYISMRKSRGL